MFQSIGLIVFGLSVTWEPISGIPQYDLDSDGYPTDFEVDYFWCMGHFWFQHKWFRGKRTYIRETPNQKVVIRWSEFNAWICRRMYIDINMSQTAPSSEYENLFYWTKIVYSIVANQSNGWYHVSAMDSNGFSYYQSNDTNGLRVIYYDLNASQWHISDAYDGDTIYATCTSLNFFECLWVQTGQTAAPTKTTNNPTNHPSYLTYDPSQQPSNNPSYPSRDPSQWTKHPSYNPSRDPSNIPSQYPSDIPSQYPTLIPSNPPSNIPSADPTISRETRTTYISAGTLDVTESLSISDPSSSPTNSFLSDKWYIVTLMALIGCLFLMCCVLLCKEGRNKRNKYDLKMQNKGPAAPSVVNNKVHQQAFRSISSEMESVIDRQTEAETAPQDDDGDTTKLNVKLWLKDSVKLPQYYTAFVKNGYDNLEFIQDIRSRNDLKEIGITLAGHQTRVMGEIKRLKDRKTTVSVDNNRKQYIRDNEQTRRKLFSIDEGKKHDDYSADDYVYAENDAVENTITTRGFLQSDDESEHRPNRYISNSTTSMT